MNPARLLLALALAGGATFAATSAPNLEKTRELVGVLQSNAELAAKARACQQLAVLGTKDAVPALAALLADPKLGYYARDALEVMPDASAAAALRAALATLRGEARVGVVNSLGMRRDAAAVEPLTKLALDERSGVAADAMLALARIGATESTATLQRMLETSPNAAMRDAAAEACLLLAEQLLARGQRPAATTMYDLVRRKTSGPLQASAARGAMLARGSNALPLVLELIRGADVELRDMALRTVRELPGAEITAGLAAELPRFAAPVQPLLIAAFVDRADPRALPAIEAGVGSQDAAVRAAGLKALGKMGANSSLPLLLHATASPTAEADLALASLARIPASDTNAMLLRALPGAPTPVRAKLIAALAERNAVLAIPELLKLAPAGDEETRKAALRALGVMARPAELPALIQLAMTAREEEMKVLADRAVATTSMKVLEVERRADAVLSAFRQAGDADTKRSLLRPLGAIVRSMGGSYEAFTVVRAALRDTTETVRDAALQCLGDWPDAMPTTTLLDLLARNPAPAQRDMALRGALRMATNVAAGREVSPLNAVAAFTQASRFVRARDEKLMFVAGLGQLRHPQTLRLLQPYLDDPEVRTEAGLALVQVAPALANSGAKDEVKAALEKVAASEKDEEIRRKAARLAKGGAPAPPAGKKKAAAAAAATATGSGATTGPIFNGKDLGNWDGDPAVWRLRDGAIVGGSLEGNPRNEFLATRRSFRNFILRLEYKLTGSEGFVNGGVQFRSVRIEQPPNEMSGYQADIGAGHSGCLYDESRRKTFLARATDEQIKRLEKPGEWNRYEIRCQGRHIELWLNGEKTVSFDEAEHAIPQAGLLALQIHGNCKAEIAFRNLELEERP